MHNYKKIKIWQKARVLVKDVYNITKQFPADELYGLTSQIRRAVVSVPANIAEGAGRGSNKEFLHFLNIAKGSLVEVETLIILANDLEYIQKETSKKILEKTSEISKMMLSFHNQLLSS